MKSTVVDESLSSFKPMYCSRENQASTRLSQQYEKSTSALENIDKNYPFSLSPTLILALLVSVGICVIVIGIIFIWYRRKASLTSSTVGNLVKLIPSLNEKVPTLNSLLPILSELASSKNKTIITATAVSNLSQTAPDEPTLPPVLVP